MLQRSGGSWPAARALRTDERVECLHCHWIRDSKPRRGVTDRRLRELLAEGVKFETGGVVGEVL